MSEVWGEVGLRGAVDCTDYTGRRWLWARCHVAGCPHTVCVRLSDRFCWPHAGNDAADLIQRATQKEAARDD